MSDNWKGPHLGPGTQKPLHRCSFSLILPVKTNHKKLFFPDWIFLDLQKVLLRLVQLNLRGKQLEKGRVDTCPWCLDTSVDYLRPALMRLSHLAILKTQTEAAARAVLSLPGAKCAIGKCQFGEHSWPQKRKIHTVGWVIQLLFAAELGALCT